MPDHTDPTMDLIREYGARRLSNEVAPNDRNAEALRTVVRRLTAQLARDRAEAYERGLMHAVEHVANLLGHGLELHVSREAAEQMLAGALETARERGLREATEGWQREWAYEAPDGARPCRDEDDARGYAELPGWGQALSRLVGPWEPAEQPEPARGGIITRSGPQLLGEDGGDYLPAHGGAVATQEPAVHAEAPVDSDFDLRRLGLMRTPVVPLLPDPTYHLLDREIAEQDDPSSAEDGDRG